MSLREDYADTVLPGLVRPVAKTDTGFDVTQIGSLPASFDFNTEDPHVGETAH
jgi:hypothetical protein